MKIDDLNDDGYLPEINPLGAERRASLYAAIAFPSDCAWCIEANHKECVIESLEELGGFDMETGLPVCMLCMDLACEELHS